MGKLGFLGVLILVAVAHFLALHSYYISKKSVISKPKAKVHRITLSRVVVKKPKPKLEPIILPPDPEPVEPVKPIIEKPKPKIKPKPKKKRVKRKKVHKQKPKPVVEKIVEEVVEPIIEQVAPVQEIDTSSIKDQYTSQIRREIQKNLYYPKMAKRMRMQGIVRVAFRVLKNGKITEIKVLNSSKKLLRKGALKTLKALSLKPIPRELHEEFLDINIPIEFKLVKG